MKKLKKRKILNGVYWVEVPEAGLSIWIFVLFTKNIMAWRRCRIIFEMGK